MTRQQSLWETLAAAASQMDARDKERPASGPPPLFTFMQPCPLEEHLRPQFLSLGQPKAGAAVGEAVVCTCLSRRCKSAWYAIK